MHRFSHIFWLPAVAVFCLSGCGYLSTASITIGFPDSFPEESGLAFTIDSWILEYPAETDNGIPVYAELEVEAAKQDAGGIRVSVVRGVNLSVLARPVFSCGDLGSISGNYPAGAVYPADLKSGRLDLHWEDGFACCIIKSCLLNSEMIQGFDTEAFRSSLQKKAGSLTGPDGKVIPGGVWLLDPGPVISRLGYGLFRESSIRAAETMLFSVPASPGTFSSDSPFYPPTPAENGYLDAVIPAERRTMFINPDSREQIELYFDSNLWCWTNITTGASKSGRR